ncbi:MAG: alcohol dehydrogenase catalytic domain-containing protein [Candidatus Zixiibacteriota bacterium]
MKAAVLKTHNQPFAFEELPIPEPGPGQALIRMHACGMCGTDVHVWRGLFPSTPPIVLGHEPVGTIEKLGDGVTWLAKGDRVGVPWVQSGCGRCPACVEHHEIYCTEARTWMENGGGWSAFMIAEATGCILIPEALSWENAAPMFCAGFTVMSGYRNGQPRTGDRIAILGVGGLGHLALQVAKAMGHETIAVTGTASKKTELLELGADDVVVVKEHAGKELAAAGGADLVLSSTNAMNQNADVLAGLRPEGRLVIMGVGAEPISLVPFMNLMGQVTVKFSMQNRRRDLMEVLDLAARGKVRPKLEIYPLERVNETLQRLIDGKVRYRAVLTHAH